MCVDPLSVPQTNERLRRDTTFSRYSDSDSDSDSDRVQHYSECLDVTEMFLPSKLQDVSKQPYNSPFTTTAQTAKHVGMVSRYAECKKPRPMYSEIKLKNNECNAVKRVLIALEVFVALVLRIFEDRINRDNASF